MGVIPPIVSILVNRPYLVIATWIIALVSLYPFFVSLESLTSATEESLLPRDSESSRASFLLSMNFGSGGSDIIYVSNIDIINPDTALKISRLIYNVSASNRIKSIGGYPQAVIELYRSVENVSNASISAASAGVKSLIETIRSIERNLSAAINAFTELSRAVREAREALINIDSNYTSAVDLAYSLSRNASSYEYGLRILDKRYSEIYWQAFNYSKKVSVLIEYLIDSDVNRNNISTLYLFIWWQAARSIYYYNISSTEYIAYTNLSTVDPSLTPLPPEMVESIYRRYLNLSRIGIQPDIAISRVASEILLPQVLRKYLPNTSDEELSVIIEILYRAWQDIYKDLSTCLYCLLSPPDREGSHIASQIFLLTKILSLRENLSSRIRDSGRIYIEDMVYRAIASQGAGEELSRGLARLIVWGNISTQTVADMVVREATRYFGDLSRYSAYISEAILSLDPEARGSIWGNESTSREALTLLISRIGGVDRNTARTIIDLGFKNASRSDFIPIVRDHVSSAAENMSRGMIKASDISYILEKYDPNATGSIVRISIINATIDLLITSSRGTPYSELLGSVPYDILASLAEGGDPVDIAKSFFLSQLLEKIRSISSEYSQEALEGMRSLASYLVNSYPNQSSDVIYGYVSNITSIFLEKETRGRGYPIDPSALKLISSLALEVAMGDLGLSSAIENASFKIFGDIYKGVLSNLTGKLVGNEGRSFIVIYTPNGSDQYAASKEFFLEVSTAIKKSYPGASVLWTGSNVIDEDLKRISSEDVARISRIGEVLVFVVLLAILGSLAAVILPYAGIVLGVVVGGGIAFFIASTGSVEILSLTRTLIYVIPLGLGSDYAAYLVYRFREEYAKIRNPKRASEEALRRAGPAIIASALTVMAGFGSLALGWEFPLFRSLGVYMPLVVAVTAASCLTLVPAILSMAGGSRRFWWGIRRDAGIDRGEGGLGRISSLIIKSGLVVPVIFALVSIISIAAYPTISLSHDLRLFLPSNSPSIAALDAIASDMGYGRIFPSYIVIMKDSSITSDDLAKIEDLAVKISSLDDVQLVEGPTRPFGTPINISSASPRDPAVSTYISNNIAYMRIVVRPNTFSKEAVDLIEEIREIAREWASRNGYQVYIGGATATSSELDKLVNSLFWYRVLPFAVISMILIFMIVFGSVLAAILAVLLVVLSSQISMVFTGFIFNKIFLTPVLWFLPQVVFTAMLGVGMDYNSFYMARAREICLVDGECNARGVARASSIVGKLIIGLAMVMAAAFGSLVLSSSIGLKEIGFSLLTSVLLVASAASYLVAPPIISRVGRRMWRRKIYTPSLPR